MTNETIRVYYYPVGPSILGLQAYHETAVYTNAAGQNFYSEATDTIPNDNLNLGTIGIAHNMVAITPGMAVTAEIKTGSRHIISYILSPIIRHKQQAFREQ